MTPAEPLPLDVRPASVGFSAGSDVQAIGDGDFVLSLSSEADNPILRVNVSDGDVVSVIFVPSSGVRNASLYNASIANGRRDVTYVLGSESFVISFTEVVNGQLGILFPEIGGFFISEGYAAIAITVNDVFCGRVLAFNAQHTVEDAKSIPLPVLLNGTWTNSNGTVGTTSSWVHAKDGYRDAWLDYPASDPQNLLKAAHFEIFMFNSEASMLAITTEGGPDVNINKRRYGLVVDVEPDDEETFALTSSKLFGSEISQWCWIDYR